MLNSSAIALLAPEYRQVFAQDQLIQNLQPLLDRHQPVEAKTRTKTNSTRDTGLLTVEERQKINWNEFKPVVIFLAAILAYYYTYGKVNPKELSILNKGLQPTIDFYKRIKVDASDLKKAVALITKKAKGERVILEMEKFAVKTRPMTKAIANSPVDKKLATLYGYIMLLFVKDSENAINQVVKTISQLGLPWLNQVFLPAKSEPTTDLKSLRKFIKRETGKDSDHLDPKDRVILVQDKRRWKEFLALNNKVNLAYKDTLIEIVRASGKDHLPVEKVKRGLQDAGFSCWQIPKGFVGNVDESGRMYTSQGRPLDKGQIGGWMKMNPMYDAANNLGQVATGKGMYADSETKPQPFYTLEHIKKREEKKDQIEDDAKKMPQIRQRWLHDMLTARDENGVLGLLVEAAWQMIPRPGTEGNDTQGFSTLYVGDVTPIDGGKGVRITYVGKDEVKQSHDIVAGDPKNVKAKVVAGILKLARGRPKGDRLWVYNGRPIKGEHIRAYLRSHGWAHGLHKFRRVRGTQMFLKLQQEKPFKIKHPSRQQAEAYMKEIITDIGKVLGHVRRTLPGHEGEQKVTWTTSANSYVSHKEQIKFMAKYGLGPPSWLLKMGVSARFKARHSL